MDEISTTSVTLKTYKVFATRSETIVTEVQANSTEEALRLADDNFSQLSWKEVDGSMSTDTFLADEVKL